MSAVYPRTILNESNHVHDLLLAGRRPVLIYHWVGKLIALAVHVGPILGRFWRFINGLLANDNELMVFGLRAALSLRHNDVSRKGYSVNQR